MSEVLTELETLIGKEGNPESAVDYLGLEYEIYEDIQWIDDGKYQHGALGIQIGKEYFWIGASRSGSYYSEWYYSIDSVTQFTPDTRYHVNYTFPSKEVAQEFVKWMCGQGEQIMWEYGDLELNREVVYDYEKGSLEISEKFDE